MTGKQRKENKMDPNKRKLAMPGIMQAGVDYVGGPLESGVMAAHRLGTQAANYVRNIINSQAQQQAAISSTQPRFTQQQVDEINATPGVSKKYKQALWEVMQNQ